MMAWTDATFADLHPYLAELQQADTSNPTERIRSMAAAIKARHANTG